jgi:hypothetical protein
VTARRALLVLVLVGIGLGVVPFATSPAGGQTPGPVDPRLFVIGDSVLLGAHDALVARLPGWTVTVYAQEGLSTLGAPSIIAANRPNIGEVAVVALGNNDQGNPVTFGQRIDGVMQALTSTRRVIWVNLRPFASGIPAMNAQLQAATTRWPNLEIADWNARAAPDPSLVYGDGLHLTPAGAAAMAELVATHLGAYVQQREQATSTTTSTLPPPTTRPRHPRRAHPHPAPASSALPIALGALAAALVAAAAAWGVTRRIRRHRAPGTGAEP